MTATSSHNALPFRNALRVVSQNKKMTIVTCILQFFGIPLAMTASMLAVIADSHTVKDGAIYKMLSDMHVEIYAGIGVMLASAAIFMGMFAAINSFTELFKKTQVDMLYSLPLTGTQRFFSNYLGGCLMYIVPYLAAVLLGWIILFGLSPFVNWGYEFQNYNSFGEFMGEIGKYYGLGTLGLLFLMLLYYTLTVLVTVCCGTLFETLYTTILLNCLIPGTLALIIGVITSKLDMEFEYSWYCIGYMSPIGGLIYLIMLLTGEMNVTMDSNAYHFSATQTISHQMLPSYCRWIIAIILLTAAMTAGAWFLYKRRKSEETGKPFVFILAYYIMLTLGTLAILCISAVEENFIGPAIFIAAVAYFIMEVIRKRGFRKFWLSIVTFAATVIASFGCYALIINTDGFGRTNYVPTALNVRSVCVEYFDQCSNRQFEYRLEYTDRDVINQIISLHHDLLADRKADNGSKRYQTRWAADLNAQMLSERWARLDYDRNSYAESTFHYSLPYSITGNFKDLDQNITSSRSQTNNKTMMTSEIDKLLDPSVSLPEGMEGEYTNGYNVSLTYYTRTGSTVHRTYQVNTDEMQRLMNIVHDTDLYAEALSSGLSARFNMEYTSYDDKLKKSTIPNSIQFKMSNIADDAGIRYRTQTVYMPDAPAKLLQLAAAYEKDLTAMTAEDFRTAKIYGYLSQLPVYENCKETIALLESFGVQKFDLAERLGIHEMGSGEYSGIGVLLFKPEQNRTASVNYPHSTAADIYFKTTPAYEDVILYRELTSMREEYPELYKLLEAARSNYVTDENCYVLYFDGVSYIIPEADAQLAEALIQKGDGYYLNKNIKFAYDYGWQKTTGTDYFD